MLRGECAVAAWAAQRRCRRRRRSFRTPRGMALHRTPAGMAVDPTQCGQNRWQLQRTRPQPATTALKLKL
eukprot:scaffold80309_cov72-Phaeocystis_antarctica.AAC.2